MPVDHCKVSMEVRPLRLLYSKYGSQAPPAPGTVRPLGAVRQGSSSARGKQLVSLFKLGGEVSRSERVERYLAMSGESSVPAEMYGGRKSLPAVTDISDDKPRCSSRARNRSFENKYKLALSRGNHEKKTSKLYSNRVIQLPMLKINVETYVGESEDNRALESTRRSLRNILDVSSKPGHAVGLRQAGITQYQFKTPGEMHREALKLRSQQACPLHHHRQVDCAEPETQEPGQTLGYADDEFQDTSESSETPREDSIIYETGGGESDGEVFDDVYDVDRASVMAQRLSSAATLGTSYRNLDFESFFSDGDEPASTGVSPRTGPDVNNIGPEQFNDYPPKWPSFEDSRNLRVENGAYGLSIKPRRAKEVQFMERGAPIIMKKGPPDGFVIRNGVVPKFKVAKLHHRRLKPARQLDPMIPQPHYARDCPMCNLYKEREPTLCPPNTPRHPDDIVPDILSMINRDSLRESDVRGREEEEDEDDDEEEADEEGVIGCRSEAGSDIMFRRRHQLMNYDINAAPRLGPIEAGAREKIGTRDQRFGYICPKTAT